VPIAAAATTSWFGLVRWYTYAVVEAQEQGVTRANAEEMRRISVRPNTRRLLGVTPELG
jgi:general L-amino acid transport system substrate-binding protein